MLAAMSQLRTLVHANKIPWILYVIVSLIFIQSLKLHVHTYNHDTNLSVHTHSGQMHFSYNVSQPAAPDEVAEIKLDQFGFVGKVTGDVLGIALITVISALLLVTNTRSPLIPRVSPSPVHRGRDAFPPPLRAPPLSI